VFNHDFELTERYMVFVIDPITVELAGLSAVALGLRAFDKASPPKKIPSVGSANLGTGSAGAGRARRACSATSQIWRLSSRWTRAVLRSRDRPINVRLAPRCSWPVGRS
jgi:carotenoid cleavage dioxygenase-like enzyme